jgi:hypothetical protein
MAEHSYLSFWPFVFPSYIWFGLVGFLPVHKCFSIAARVAYSADMFLKIKTVCLHDVIPEMHSFSVRPATYFYD